MRWHKGMIYLALLAELRVSVYMAIHYRDSCHVTLIQADNSKTKS